LRPGVFALNTSNARAQSGKDAKDLFFAPLRHTVDTEGETHGVYTLLGLLFAWLSKRKLERDFELLKARLEGLEESNTT
jgi:hypothetical protein